VSAMRSFDSAVDVAVIRGTSCATSARWVANGWPIVVGAA